MKSFRRCCKSTGNLPVNYSLIVSNWATSIFWILTLLLTIEALSGCDSPRPNADLQASRTKNGHIFKKVIDHYSLRASDSLKLRAARFLIENMSNKVTLVGANESSIDTLSRKIFRLRKSVDFSANTQDAIVKAVFDTLKLFRSLNELSEISDLSYVTPQLLIENVDDAFYAWRTYPWSKHINFDDFCEYILPYKVYTEPISSGWRKHVREEFASVIDSMMRAPDKSLPAVTSALNRAIAKKSSYCPAYKNVPLAISYTNLGLAGLGKCEHLVTYSTYVLRALGVPAMIDFVPTWGNNSSGHTWGSILDETGRLITFDAIYSDAIGNVGSTNVIPEGVLRDRRAPKIRRMSYRLQKTQLGIDDSALQEYAQMLVGQDVTKDYQMKSAALNLTVKDKFDPANGSLFLCVYNTNKWKPCAVAQRKDRKAYAFSHLGTSVVYTAASLQGGSLLPIGSPFVLLDNNKVRWIHPRKANITMRVDRKANEDYDLKLALKEMLSAEFQGSKGGLSSRFKPIVKIEKEPEPRYNTYYCRDTSYYRFIKFTTPLSRCRVAELRFYGVVRNIKTNITEKDAILTGKLFSDPHTGINEPANIIDNNVLTYYVSESQKNGYVGLDLGEDRVARITRVLFYPPNDGNSVETGDTYELCFWDAGWRTVERKVATTEKLTFHDCPANALFRLRNLTKGYKERIFTYENGKQIWW